MEKNTVVAIALSIVVIVGFYFVQYTFFPPPARPAPVAQTEAAPSPQAGTPATGSLQPGAAGAVAAREAGAEAYPEEEAFFTVETPLIVAQLSNRGGELRSFKLKEHSGEDGFVEMILSGDQPPRAFGIAFGGREAELTGALFAVNQVSPEIVEFYRDFALDGAVFRLNKRYTFLPAEYLFQLDITLDSTASGILPEFNGKSYTLAFGPQIGPEFDVIDERSEYRHYHTYINGKQKQQKVSDTADVRVNGHVSWAAIAGKYFAFFVLPDETPYEFIFSQRPPEPGLRASARLFIERPPVKAVKTTDSFKVYFGPKTQKALARYDNADNYFALTDTRMETLANASGFWGILSPLETALKWMLSLFYKLIPNYGVAIILVTLLVKVILFPLTKKSSEGTLRMQALAPKMKELQDKYKDNPQKLNAELAAFYKKENYNPMSGCLPMLIQFPIFIAMYNLFNNHFDLRNALFIPGWIPDLSRPESILHFDFHIPILGWSDLRLLPFLYVGSQLLYAKVTQTPDTAMNQQMKIMMYFMPVMFFFLLYNVPSGLLVYWIASNILTMMQQLAINKYLRAKKAEMAGARVVAEQRVRPPKKRKRK
jgi:YidC/Oxa1 family membrane protein insertase